MAHRITYKYRNQAKEILFTFDKFRDMYEAVAAAEGVDLTQFFAMEKQVAMTSRGNAALRDFRKNEFARMGFTELYFHKEVKGSNN